MDVKQLNVIYIYVYIYTYISQNTYLHSKTNVKCLYQRR